MADDNLLRIAYREYAACLEQLKEYPAFKNVKAWEKVIIDNGGTIEVAEPADSTMADIRAASSESRPATATPYDKNQ